MKINKMVHIFWRFNSGKFLHYSKNLQWKSEYKILEGLDICWVLDAKQLFMRNVGMAQPLFY